VQPFGLPHIGVSMIDSVWAEFVSGRKGRCCGSFRTTEEDELTYFVILRISPPQVCLSLLGTFNALDESERWNPDRSSLSQVLLSIQTQLLVEEPYFNEPGAERMEGTEAGRDASRRYNANLRLATLRYAIIQPLKHLPLGFEEISIRHFSMCRKRILVQAKRWMLESKNSSLFPRFEKAYTELLHLLSTKERINYFDALVRNPISQRQLSCAVSLTMFGFFIFL
jgi:hypothetical protein